MLQFKTGKLSEEEEKIVCNLLEEILDVFGEMYITKGNSRLFLKENKELLFSSLEKGDKIAFDEKLGIAFVTGWSDNFNRKYLKVLSKDNTSANQLLKLIFQNVKCEVYTKIKRTNPLKEVLETNGFKFFKNRGKEVLMIKHKSKE